jgi:hypothetical protein
VPFKKQLVESAFSDAGGATDYDGGGDGGDLVVC